METKKLLLIVGIGVIVLLVAFGNNSQQPVDVVDEDEEDDEEDDNLDKTLDKIDKPVDTEDDLTFFRFIF